MVHMFPKGDVISSPPGGLVCRGNLQVLPNIYRGNVPLINRSSVKTKVLKQNICFPTESEMNYIRSY